MKKLKNILAAGAICAIIAGTVALTGCASSSPSSASTSPSSESPSAEVQTIDYMALVNKQNHLPDNWENEIETISVKNSQGDEVVVEKKAYDAYLELKEDLEADGIKVDLDSAYRPTADQQRIWDEFTRDYGEEYTKTHVAVPGYSEHQTGLALDLYLNVDGKDITENFELMEHPDIWDKIHSKLAKHGFILRYLDGTDDITGYAYEPWHIRYIDDPTIAGEIMDKNLTFEEYLGVSGQARAANAKEKADAEAAVNSSNSASSASSESSQASASQ